MRCNHCGKAFANESFECPSCGKELISRKGLKAIRGIFWALIGIWIILCLQMEIYFPIQENAGNTLWTLRINELTFVFLAFALCRYWERKSFFPILIFSLVFYVLTLWWIQHGFAQLTGANMSDTAHFVPRAIFAFIAVTWAYFTSLQTVDWKEKERGMRLEN